MIKNRAIAISDDTTSLTASEANARHVGSCVQQLLVELGHHLPNLHKMAATAGCLQLLATPTRHQLPLAVFEALCGLFVSQDTLPSILASSFLHSGSPFKGRTSSVHTHVCRRFWKKTLNLHQVPSRPEP
jgi:hypothetical protein